MRPDDRRPTRLIPLLPSPAADPQDTCAAIIFTQRRGINAGADALRPGNEGTSLLPTMMSHETYKNTMLLAIRIRDFSLSFLSADFCTNRCSILSAAAEKRNCEFVAPAGTHVHGTCRVCESPASFIEEGGRHGEITYNMFWKCVWRRISLHECLQ